MTFFYIDTETVGLHGPIVLLQYAEDDGDVILHSVWNEPIYETMLLIEKIVQGIIIGFNLTFDWFHICQLYTVLQLLGQKVGFDKYPVDYIDLYAELEPEGRFGPCLKPRSAFDLMLHARKGPYQSLMNRDDIRIKKVPRILADALITELEKRVPLKDIYFARKKEKTATRWQIQPIKKLDGNYDDAFVNVVLRFASSSALKILATDALNLDPENTMLFRDVEPTLKPVELGYAPFAMAIGKPGYWQGTWPDVISHHISHWSYYKPAREYAEKDVDLTRRLYKHFGSPEPGDRDSILACMVGACRWKGYAIEVEGIKQLREQALLISKSAPKAPKQVYNYIAETLSDIEKVGLNAKHEGSTKKAVLEELSKWKDDSGNPHPASVRAKECLEARKAQKEVEIYDKLLQAGRFHASFVVIGTKSSRMSGTDKLNAQGIKHAKYVRKCFPLADGSLVLCGGDFSSFEVSIADAVYHDPTLRRELLTCANCGYLCTPDEYRDTINCPNCSASVTKCGNCKKSIDVYPNKEIICTCGKFKDTGEREDSRRKIHGLFGMELFPGSDYNDIVATKGSKDEDRYDIGKRGVFSQLYGGNYQTMVKKLAITEEVARNAEQSFMRKYSGVGAARKRIEDQFCTMRQQRLGGPISWSEPSDSAVSLTGFRRYFTLENRIAEALYKLAMKPPPQWKNVRLKVVRSNREQWVTGAAMSAVFSAAFQLQAANMRAAANHEIQSTGAEITKELEVRIWELQPAGIGPWQVQPMNVHDEIQCPTLPHLKPAIRAKVDSIINDYKTMIPLIKIDWSDNMQTWADK